jgi:two-component system, chemotaxis family, protein-glutamate methylesterase/glutaminase
MTDPILQMPKRGSADLTRDVILIGASAGGIQAIGKVLAELPPTLRAAVAITLHRSPSYPSLLGTIFGARSKLDVVEPKGGELFEPGRVYLAPPARHLVFANGLVRLDDGPRVHHSRPSIDVMFRSGAENFGSRVIGVILTGHLADGVAGLKAITAAGGLSIAQEPSEAFAPSMPENAVKYDDVDVIFNLSAAAEVISKLVASKGVDAAARTHGARRRRDVPLPRDV